MLRLIAIVTVLVCSAACQKKVPLPPAGDVLPEPRPSEVDDVVILVGDMGAAIWERSPLPQRLAAEVERWSAALRRDSSVAVIFLGDNVYPKGLRADPEFFSLDSAHLETHVDIFTGPNARRYGAFGLFVAGNHDWGQTFGEPGERRLRNQEEFLMRRRERGIRVQLLPKAGTPGPGIVDVGRKLRFILLDTAWWLYSADAYEKARTMTRLERGMQTAVGRSVIMAAHHPMKSASAHGGAIGLFELFGIKWLFYKTGAALQDLNSLPYRDLLNQFDAVFSRTGPPLIFAGGHDHSLQLIRAVRDIEPTYMIVSGAGSKSSRVGRVAGMVYRSSGPGYVQLTFKKDGGVDLAAYTAPSDYLICEDAPATPLLNCVREGIAAFKRVYSVILK